jgi:hypothetical protein
MAQGQLTRLKPHGLRALILRAVRDEGLTITQIVVRLRAHRRLQHPDPAVERLKTLGAVQKLRRGGYLIQTPAGFRTTGAGLDLLRATEGHHG